MRNFAAIDFEKTLTKYIFLSMYFILAHNIAIFAKKFSYSHPDNSVYKSVNGKIRRKRKKTIHQKERIDKP